MESIALLGIGQSGAISSTTRYEIALGIVIGILVMALLVVRIRRATEHRRRRAVHTAYYDQDAARAGPSGRGAGSGTTGSAAKRVAQPIAPSFTSPSKVQRKSGSAESPTRGRGSSRKPYEVRMSGSDPSNPTNTSATPAMSEPPIAEPPSSGPTSTPATLDPTTTDPTQAPLLSPVPALRPKGTLPPNIPAMPEPTPPVSEPTPPVSEPTPAASEPTPAVSEPTPSSPDAPTGQQGDPTVEPADPGTAPAG